MHRILMALSTTALAASGCIVYDDGPEHHDDVVVVHEDNYSPAVSWGDAGCYWDDYYRDDIWYFEADVDDPNSPYDVVAVYADVYDYNDNWIDSFELYPTDDPYFWFSDWLGSSTYLDCHYGGYIVDIVAYDALEAYDIYSLVPDTYGSYY